MKERLSTLSQTNRATGRVRQRERERDREKVGGSVSGARTVTETGRETERDTVMEMESFTTVFCRDCSTVYPGLLQAITARVQATSSLEKTF